MKYIVALLTLCFLLTLLKIGETAGFHITDANNYIYLAKLITQGKIIYKDIYFDNLPLMLYVSVIYRAVTFGSMQFFNMTSMLEKTAITILLYFIGMKLWKKESTAFFVALTFFCSYTILSSSLQLGFHTSVLCIVLAYYFSLEKKLVWAGIFAAAAVLIKGYALFPVIALLLYLYPIYRYKTIRFVLAGVGLGIVVMLPTFILAFPEFWKQTLGYGLVRVPADDKTYIYLGFIQYDALTAILLLWNLTLFRKNIFVFASTLLLVLFFLFYKDIYYVYFTFLPVYAALGVGYLLEEPLPFSKIIVPNVIYATVLVVVTLMGLSRYLTVGFRSTLLPDHEKMFRLIEDQKPDTIYGLSFLTNGISYVTGIPVYKNMYDVNATQFLSHSIDRSQFTKQLLKTRTLVLLDTIQIDDRIVFDEDIFDSRQINPKSCRIVYTAPLKAAENITKGISVIRCY